MPEPPRILLPKTLVLVTCRMETGLPLVCTEYMSAIIWSALARAQFLYPVRICAFVVMGNHFHILLCVAEPGDIVGFMDRIKTETAHAVNRLLGYRQRTVWCDGYDAEPILTVNDAVSRFVYLYTNPQRARLVSSIEEYPGVSSWELWQSGQYEKRAGWIQRPFIERLKKFSVTEEQDRALTEQLLAQCKEWHVLTLEPNAWFECFGIASQQEIARLNSEIVQGIREEETRLDKEYKGWSVGREALRRQSIIQRHQPKKFGRRMWCICRDIDLRKSFINFIKALRHAAREVWQRWKLGDFSARYPIGLFPPSLPRNANLVPFALY